MQKKSSALDRARADLAAERPDLARDRLHGYLRMLHRRGEYNQDAYLLLGDVYFSMRDLPRAGAAWLLTERDDADAKTAFDAFQTRFGSNAQQALDAVKPRAPSELYPPKVQERLRTWGYRYYPYRSRARRGESDPETPPVEGVRPVEAGCIIVAIFLFVLIAVYAYFMLFRRH